MSTNIPLASGNSFRFSKEIFDEQYVYLELKGVEFEASQNRVKISIPIGIWEVIRKLGAPDLEFIDTTDGELLILVEKEVDERIQEHEQNPTANISGTAVFGRASDLKEDQIQRRMEYYKKQRQEQQEIKAMIDSVAKGVEVVG